MLNTLARFALINYLKERFDELDHQKLQLFSGEFLSGMILGTLAAGSGLASALSIAMSQYFKWLEVLQTKQDLFITI